mgnify:CR=1 FL=1
MQQKEKKEEIQWDKKKIIFAVIVAILLIGIGFELKSVFLVESQPIEKVNQNSNAQIKGASTNELTNGIKQSFADNINSLKAQAQNIDIAEIASSSPQVQKVINDLKGLKDLPKNEIKSACEKICSGL